MSNAPSENPRFTNPLVEEKSPYLLQHAHNPVFWHAWRPEVFDKAKNENKPIFLSIGYSTCHWCHVMERESFENEEIAALLNRDFVSIKVDREERPDVDNVYMNLAQAMNGGGGWPLNLFLTPDRVPFFSGTYFPPEDGMGRPGFKSVLRQIADQWTHNPERIREFASNVKNFLEQQNQVPDVSPPLGEEVLKKAYEQKKDNFEDEYGGFGQQPKFPMGHSLSFLLRYQQSTGEEKALHMATHTLDNMQQGGLYDQLAGGFHRYSVDRRWLVPHFEKMLYDQALLIKAYLEAYQVTGKREYARIASETIAYVKRDMTHLDGGFFSAEDADSEGEEGLFYVWDKEEVMHILGEERARFACDYFGVTDRGNFEGKNILTAREEWRDFARERGWDEKRFQSELASVKTDLLAVRNRRVRPHLDDKILTDWNGLMISALAMACRILPEDDTLPAGREMAREMGVRAADFVLSSLVDEQGRLLKHWREGASRQLGFLEDYAFLVNGLVDLYEGSFEPRWLKEAIRFAGEMHTHFWDKDRGGFFLVGRFGESLITNPREIYDGAIPSGNSMAAYGLFRLGKLTGEKRYLDLSEKTLQAFGASIERFPSGYPQALQVLDLMVHPGQEFVLAGSPEDQTIARFTDIVFTPFLPRKVVLLNPPGEAAAEMEAMVPFLKFQKMQAGKPTFFLCENYACQVPLVLPEEVAAEVEKLVQGILSRPD